MGERSVTGGSVITGHISSVGHGHIPVLDTDKFIAETDKACSYCHTVFHLQVDRNVLRRPIIAIQVLRCHADNSDSNDGFSSICTAGDCLSRAKGWKNHAVPRTRFSPSITDRGSMNRTAVVFCATVADSSVGSPFDQLGCRFAIRSGDTWSGR